MHHIIKSTLSMSPVIPVLTIDKVKNVEYLFEALICGNLKVVEITLRTSCALKVIEIASKKGTTCPCASRGCKVAGCQTFITFQKLHVSFYIPYCGMKTAPPMNTFDFLKY